MTCPKCGHEQASAAECERCGVIFGKLRAAADELPTEGLPDRFFPSAMQSLVGETKLLLVDQNPRAR